MSNVIEKFAIAFGFDGKEALKGIDQTEKGLTKVKKASKATSTAMVDDGKAAAKAFSAIRNEIILLTGALVGATGFKSFISNSIDDITKLGFAAKNLGVTTEKLEAFQLANEKLGGSKGGITSLLANASKSLSELRTSGSGLLTDSSDMFSFLARGGSSAGLKTSEDVIYQFADLLQKAFAEGEGTGMNVAEKLGITGDSINLMRLGSAEVRKMVEAQKAYATISAADAQKTQDFNVEVMNMKDSFMAVGREIFIGLLPALKEANGIFLSLGKWFNSHKNDIGAKIGEWANKATEFIKALFGDDAKISSTLDNWANNFERLVTAIEKLAKAAGVINDTYDFFNPSEYKPDSNRPRKESSGMAGLVDEYIPAIKGALTGKPEKQLADAARKHGFDYNKVRGAFADASKKYGIDEGILMAQAYQESGFNPRIGSNKGALGFSQFIKGTADQYGLSDRTDPVASIYAQAHHMSDLRAQNKGNMNYALAGYNAGQGAVNKYHGIPPYKETQNYVSSINARRNSWTQADSGGTQITMNNPTFKANDVAEMKKQIDKAAKPLMSNNYAFAGQR